MQVKREHAERARSGYAWDISKDWNVEASIEAVRELTEKLGFKEGDYVLVPDHWAMRMRLSSPSDRWSGVEGYARCRIVDVLGDVALVIRPDSYRATGESVEVPTSELIWCI